MYKIRCDSREWMIDSVSGRIREIISRIQMRDDNYTREVREIQQYKVISMCLAWVDVGVTNLEKEYRKSY